MSTITSKSTPITATVHIGHSAPTTPKTNDVVGFAYNMTVAYGNGKIHRHNQCRPVKGKTNNQLDLLAMVFALQALKEPADVTFVTDSKYILDTFAKLRKYVQAGWKTRTGSEVANKEGWQCLIATAKKGGHHFTIVKAEGIDAFQVSNCHLEAKKAVNLCLMEELQPESKAAPAPAAKTESSQEAKAPSAPAAKTESAPALPEGRGDIPREQLEQLYEEALNETERFLLKTKIQGVKRFSE